MTSARDSPLIVQQMLLVLWWEKREKSVRAGGREKITFDTGELTLRERDHFLLLLLLNLRVRGLAGTKTAGNWHRH